MSGFLGCLAVTFEDRDYSYLNYVQIFVQLVTTINENLVVGRDGRI